MLNFFAPINNLGYGVFSHGLIRAYDQHVSKDIALFPVPQADLMDEAIQRWIENGVRFNKNDPSIMIFQAPWLNRFVGKPMIGFPIFELDVVPDLDLKILQGLDAILQPSSWGKKVLENHGLSNVHVVPGGYDADLFVPDLTIQQKMERIQKQGVSFVHVGKFEVRKSSEELLHCFARASSEVGDAKCNLIFHVMNPFDQDWLGKVRSIVSRYGFSQSGSHYVRGNTRILVPEGRFTTDLKKLYQMAEFGLWASKAEGWNLPLLECIAAGRPCLTTNNTAQGDFIRAGVYPSELIIASHQKEPTRVGGHFWPLDQEEVVQKIRNLIQEPLKYLNLENKCLESVKDFTWVNSAKKLQEVLKKI
jgi:glycosyltransferase involved in cell wall biosynthesis